VGMLSLSVGDLHSVFAGYELKIGARVIPFNLYFIGRVQCLDATPSVYVIGRVQCLDLTPSPLSSHPRQKDVEFQELR
jgi:hypothetical protein